MKNGRFYTKNHEKYITGSVEGKGSRTGRKESKLPILLTGVVFVLLLLLGFVTGSTSYFFLAFIAAFFFLAPMMGGEGGVRLRKLQEAYIAQIRQDIVPKPPCRKMIPYTLMACFPFYIFLEISAFFAFAIGWEGWVVTAIPVGVISVLRMNKIKTRWREMNGKVPLFWLLQIGVYLLMVTLTGLGFLIV